MELTEAQYGRIKEALPVQRGDVSLSNLQVLNAVLYVAEQGCKWRGLPKRFGRWHTVYTRMSRWSKAGVLDRIFEKLQVEQIVRIKLEAVSLDSTSIKVHPDGTGALKKRTTVHRQVPRRIEHQGFRWFRPSPIVSSPGNTTVRSAKSAMRSRGSHAQIEHELSGRIALIGPIHQHGQAVGRAREFPQQLPSLGRIVSIAGDREKAMAVRAMRAKLRKP